MWYQMQCDMHYTVVPTGSPSRGGEVTVCVKDINQPSLPTPFSFCSCVNFCLYGPLNCISFYEFSRQLSVFSLYSSGLVSALVVLSTVCLFMKVSFSPDIIPSARLGSKHQLTNITHYRNNNISLCFHAIVIDCDLGRVFCSCA